MNNINHPIANFLFKETIYKNVILIQKVDF